jgi:hypothetical protein
LDVIIIPLQAVPNQTINIQLGGQYVVLNIYQKFFGVFMDVFSNGSVVVQGVICQNLNRIVRDLYFGFVGDFVWIDSFASDDPTYTGVGSRFNLAYLEASDLNGQG